MRNTIWLTVEFSPVSEIHDVAIDLVSLAGKMGITVWASFNGVRLCAHGGDDPRKLELNYHDALLAPSVKQRMQATHRAVRSPLFRVQTTTKG